MADPERAPAALQAALKSAGLSLDEDIASYLADVCKVEGEDEEALSQELTDALAPHLEEAGASGEQLASVVSKVARAILGAPAAASAPGGSTTAGSGVTDESLCCIKNLILMYGGSSKPLLRNTTLELKRNHRYGIVGANGAGKTTLFQAVLSGAVKELSSTRSIIHVSGASANEHKDLETTAVDYATERRKALGKDATGIGGSVEQALSSVGFDKEMQSKTIRELSGGWRMRLALGCAMMKKSDVLLLDEPTNHLDVAAVDWLGKYCGGLTGTCLIISHEPAFLDAVCTDIIHFDEQKLNYYPGNFTTFCKKAALNEAAAAEVLETKGSASMNSAAGAIRGHQDEVRIIFPNPGVLEKTKTILEGKDISFAYAEGERMVLDHLSCKFSQNSRVAVVGKNGAGKSTLLSVVCGELGCSEREDGTTGEIIRNPNLRLSYIAQQHTFHLEEFLGCTPIQYFQNRFRKGYDEMLQRRLIDPANEEERELRKELASKYGKYGKQVGNIVGRQKHGKSVVYEVAWEGMDDAKQNTYEPLSKLKLMKVDSFARAYDERFAAQASGADLRPLTDREIKGHLEDFIITEDMAIREINKFSGGQRCRLMLAAAFWTKPHIIALDEPTNYLDPETVNSLARALRNFKGGVITVTHSEHFINEVCSEAWLLEDCKITVSKLSKTPYRSSLSVSAESKDQAAEAPKVEEAAAKPLSAAAAAAARRKDNGAKGYPAAKGAAAKK